MVPDHIDVLQHLPLMPFALDLAPALAWLTWYARSTAATCLSFSSLARSSSRASSAAVSASSCCSRARRSSSSAASC
jgi:hypothetical protein